MALTDQQRILKRLGQIEKRIIDIEAKVDNVTYLLELTHTAPEHTGVTQVEDSLHAPGTGRLGGSHGRELSADAIAALAAMGEPPPTPHPDA